MSNLRQTIEIFHILLTKALLAGADKSLIVLKGGCNLRFFHHSNRYSEDIDFDVMTIAKETLRKRVEKAIASQGLKSALATHNITILSSSAPKQTETVQRWKIAIEFKGVSIPTKMEFSRRGIDQKYVQFSPIDPSLLGQYAISTTLISHYNATSAIQQKILALAGRPETQARDIYDLDHLITRLPTAEREKILASINLDEKLLQQAIRCAEGVGFDQFRGQVVEYLEDEVHSFYLEAQNWDRLLARVIAVLESLSHESH